MLEIIQEDSFPSSLQERVNALLSPSGYKLDNMVEVIIYYKGDMRFLHFSFQAEEIY